MMNNNEYKKGILKKLFKKENVYQNVESIDINTPNKFSKEIFKNKVYVPEIEKLQREKNIKEKIINMVEKNPELLETMSIVNLNKLIELYDEIIQNNNNKIRLLKNKI